MVLSSSSLHVSGNPVQVGINPGIDAREIAPGALYAKGSDSHHGPSAVLNEEHGPAGVPGAGVTVFVPGTDLLGGADRRNARNRAVGVGARGAGDQLNIGLGKKSGRFNLIMGLDVGFPR